GQDSPAPRDDRDAAAAAVCHRSPQLPEFSRARRTTRVRCGASIDQPRPARRAVVPHDGARRASLLEQDKALGNLEVGVCRRSQATMTGLTRVDADDDAARGLATLRGET